jgi:hypothetical protein
MTNLSIIITTIIIMKKKRPRTQQIPKKRCGEGVIDEVRMGIRDERDVEAGSKLQKRKSSKSEKAEEIQIWCLGKDQMIQTPPRIGL